MKRNVVMCLAAMAFAGCLSVSAQGTKANEYTDKYSVATNRFGANWFIGANVGGQLYLGDGSSMASNWKLITPVFEINAGKWFTPGIGVRLGVGGFSAKGYSASRNIGYYDHDIKNGLYSTKKGIFTAHADVMFNLSNLFCGYNENRVYNAIPYASIGYMRSVGKDAKDNEPTVGVGFINRFRVSKAWDINLELRGTMVNDVMDKKLGGKNVEGSAAVMVGATYHFKKRGWTKASTVSPEEMAAVQNQLKALNAENKNLKDQIEDLKANANKPAPVVETPAEQKAYDMADYVVFFNIGKSDLNGKEYVNLKNVADQIKANPDTKFKISGYADKQTGSAALNQKLSEKRADAVYDALVNKFGVNKDQLVKEGNGGVDTMFDNNSRLSRATIVSLTK